MMNDSVKSILTHSTAIERSIMNDSQNAQSLTPALSQRERVRTAESAVANYGKINNAWREVGRPRPHESAVLHVLGEATYTDDIPEVQERCMLRSLSRRRTPNLIRDKAISVSAKASASVAFFAALSLPLMRQNPFWNHTPKIAEFIYALNPACLPLGNARLSLRQLAKPNSSAALLHC